MWRDVVLVAQLGPGHAAAAAALRAEGVGEDGLDVALGRQGDDELLVVDEVLDVHVAGIEGDLGAPLVGELLLHVGQLVLDHAPQHGLVAEDGLRRAMVSLQRRRCAFSRSTRARRVSRPSCMLEDVLGLRLGELERRRAQPSRAAARSSLPRIVAMTSSMTLIGLEQALVDVGLALRLLEAELRPAADDLDLVVDVGLQRLDEVERAGDAVDEGHGVDREVRLQRRVLVEVVEDDEPGRVLLQLDHEAGLAPGRLVVDVADALDGPGLHELGDAGGGDRDGRLVRHLGDHDLVAARPLPSSISHTARRRIEPLPVR